MDSAAGKWLSMNSQSRGARGGRCSTGSVPATNCASQILEGIRVLLLDRMSSTSMADSTHKIAVLGSAVLCRQRRHRLPSIVELIQVLLPVTSSVVEHSDLFQLEIAKDSRAFWKQQCPDTAASGILLRRGVHQAACSVTAALQHGCQHRATGKRSADCTWIPQRGS